MEEEKLVNKPEAMYGGIHYTYADYLKFTFDEMVEIIEDKIFSMSPAPTSFHQRVSRRLCTEIDYFLKG